MIAASATNRVLATAFVVAAIFPYIKGIPGLDTQPWALGFASLIVILRFGAIGLAPIHFGLGLMGMAAIGMFMLEGGGFGSARYLIGYLSLPIFALAAAFVAGLDAKRMARLIDIGILVWIAVGLLQRFVSHDAFAFLISAGRSSQERGVNGLAPEPTFYATMVMLLVLWRALLGLRAWHILALAIVTFILASSSQIVLVILAACGVAVVTLLPSRRYWWVSLSVPFLVLAIGYAVTELTKDTRLGHLATLAISRPEAILQTDASINERLLHIVASIVAIKANSFLPVGLLTEQWTIHVNRVAKMFPDIFFFYETSDRILSALGAMIYQMGFLILPTVAAAVAAVFRWRQTFAFKAVWSTAFVLVFLTALPLTHPMLGTILGTLAYVAARRTDARPLRTGQRAGSPPTITGEPLLGV